MCPAAAARYPALRLRPSNAQAANLGQSGEASTEAFELLRSGGGGTATRRLSPSGDDPALVGSNTSSAGVNSPTRRWRGLPCFGVHVLSERERAEAGLPVVVQAARRLPMVPPWTPAGRPRPRDPGRRGRRRQPGCGRCWPSPSPSCPPRRTGRSSPSGTATAASPPLAAGEVAIASRRGLDMAAWFTELRGLARALGRHQAVLDGEVVALDPAGRPGLHRPAAAHARPWASGPPGRRGRPGRLHDLRPAVAGRPAAHRPAVGGTAHAVGEARAGRAGPKPGWPSAKATTRCSTSGLVALAMRGVRRSRGCRISGPWRSSWCFQRY
jgi:hypothetical protein